ncbi:MAG: hypothetical protein P8Y64_07715 [Gammaproteobacteria bacterium]
MYSSTQEKARFEAGKVFFVSALNDAIPSGWFCERDGRVFGPFQRREEADGMLAHPRQEAA